MAPGISASVWASTLTARPITHTTLTAAPTTAGRHIPLTTGVRHGAPPATPGTIRPAITRAGVATLTPTIMVARATTVTTTAAIPTPAAITTPSLTARWRT